MRFIGISLMLGLLTVAKLENLSHDQIIVCAAFPQWYLTVTRNEFNIDEADWSCTHIQFFNYFDNVLDNDEGEFQNDDIQRITSLRNKFPNLKAITVCTDVNFFFEDFLDYDEDEFHDKTASVFFDNWISNLKYNKLDGINLDFGNIIESLEVIKRVSHKENQIFDLLIELKRIFDEEKLLLTMSFTANITNFVHDFRITEFAEYFDFVHFMPTPIDPDNDVFNRYDMTYGILELQASTIHEKVDKLIKWGVPAFKIILGINFRGILATTTLNGNINEAITSTFVPYNVLCQVPRQSVENPNGWVESYDMDTQLTMLVSNDMKIKEKLIYLYGSNRAIANDVNFARSRYLSGVLAFGIALDDFEGVCSFNSTDTYMDFEEGEKARIPKRSSTDFQLLRTVNEACFATAPWEAELESETKNEYESGSSVNAATGGSDGTTSGRFKFDSLYATFILFGIVLISKFIE